MKTSITILAALLLAASCTREAQPGPATTAVTFTLDGVTSGPLTKGVADVLTAAAPSGPITLRLTSTTNTLRT